MSNEDRLLGQFDIYARKFDFSDEHIARKYYHSKRVMERAREIALSENMDERMVEMAMVAGLLHDYSRFEQWEKYHTFRDAQSIDHADRAVEVLFENGEISHFYDATQNYDAILGSIKYHNKYAIPDGVSGDNLRLAKLIRDADKLDIIEILTWNTSLLVEIEEPVTAVVKDAFFKNQMINSHDAQNGNDWILLTLAMVYDLNYDYSFRYVAEKELVRKIFENLNHKEMFRKYFEHVQGVVEEKVR